MVLVQALVTALLSGLFSGGIIFALNERQERGRLLREKSESAIEAYSDWMDSLLRWPNSHYVMFGEDRALGRHAAEEIWSDARTKYRRAEVLIRLYLPHKHYVLTDGVGTYHDFLSAHGEMGPASITGDTMSEAWKTAIRDVNLAIINARSEGMKDLIDEGGQIALAPFQVRFPRLRK